MAFGSDFVKGALERAAKSWIFSFLAVFGVSTVSDVAAVTPDQALALPWTAGLITATLTALLSITTSIISATFIVSGSEVPLWKGLAERALKTALQTFVATLGYVAGTTIDFQGFAALPWGTAATTAIVATLFSVLTSLSNADFTKGTVIIPGEAVDTPNTQDLPKRTLVEDAPTVDVVANSVDQAPAENGDESFVSDEAIAATEKLAQR